MKSKNFEILRDKWPEMASLGGFAEQYAHPDPTSAMVKLRSYVEQMVESIYSIHNYVRPYRANLNDLLNEDAFRFNTPKTVLDKMHLIRRGGNKAAHGEKITSNISTSMLKEAFDLGRWFFMTYGKGSLENCPAYQEPPVEDTKAKIKKEKKAALQKLAIKEQEMQQLLQELEKQRTKVAAAEKSADELKSFVKAGKNSADELKFDEETTRRRLIDTMLADAGWNVGANGSNTEQVTQEEEILHQPTKTGKGRADYVLWNDSGKPLAVVEAKKTSKDAEQGRTQARIYADGLEKEYNFRPVIFYTNGVDVFIWDDAQGFPPRKIYGFYSKDSLNYLASFQRNHKKDLEYIEIDNSITDRPYQHEAIKRVRERFAGKYRNALLVQATGTGKTRVSMSLVDVLTKANWAKRILFLCDRRELRKQAMNAFNTHLGHLPLTVVSYHTAKDKDSRVYLATYPAMMKIMQTFDVGFFDLIIADESHRSIYNRYRDLFLYFDALQVGLTATPVQFIGRNTFKLFGCEDKDPTFYYSLEEAVTNSPPYLVPYQVFTHTTNFLREGIKYTDLNDDQRQQLEEDGELPELFDYEARQVDKVVFNKETNRAILRNLMENGIREASGQHVGKSIIFARKHTHAELLKKLFDEMYPQFGGKFCQVIDNYDPRAEQLIDDFKSTSGKDEITIAISVDMLDTGIDVPEIVNLSFAKPIRSQVKFEQMIGRGTRLCLNLFGPGKHKKIFWIFDHWGNFEYFRKNKNDAEPQTTKPLLQLVFESLVNLADLALQKAEPAIFDEVIKMISSHINMLPEDTIAVRDQWQTKRHLAKLETLAAFSAPIKKQLLGDIAPLMQWVNIRGYIDEYALDLLINRIQSAWLHESQALEDHKMELLDGISRLRMNLGPVRDKSETIKQVKSDTFWSALNFTELEKIRQELRQIWKYRLKDITGPIDPKIIDITDGDEQFNQVKSPHASIDMAAYEIRVKEVLSKIFDTNPTLQRISRGEAVSEADLNALCSLVLTQHENIDLNVLKSFYEQSAFDLEFIIRSIIGMEPAAVEQRFTSFIQQHPQLTAKQTRFLALLQNHISKYGTIELDRLYDAPFTNIDSDGLDGIFPDDADIDDIASIIKTFQPQQGQSQP